MKTTIRRILGLMLGWGLVVLGFIGLFVPILQGILLILLGLWVLSRESLWARRILWKLRRRFPAADRRLRELQRKFRRYRPARDRDDGDRDEQDGEDDGEEDGGEEFDDDPEMRQGAGDG